MPTARHGQGRAVLAPWLLMLASLPVVACFSHPDWSRDGTGHDRTTLRTTSERIDRNRRRMLERKKTKDSLMPGGLLEPMTHEELRDLFAHLASSEQVRLPAASGDTP